MSKLTREQKEAIYDKRKNGSMIPELAKEYGIHKNHIEYLTRLIDYQGLSILRNGKNRTLLKNLNKKL